MTAPKKIRDLGSFDDLIAQRREAVGGEGKTFPMAGFGKEWHIAAPSLQSAEWNDQLSELRNDMAEGLITQTVFRAELLDLCLGEQAEEFAAECDKIGIDPATLVTEAMQIFNEDQEENPTRRNSRSTRRRQKRR